MASGSDRGIFGKEASGGLLSEFGPGRGDRWATKGQGVWLLERGSAEVGKVINVCVCARRACVVKEDLSENWEWLRVVERT